MQRLDSSTWLVVVSKLYSQLWAEPLEGDAVTVLVDDTVAGLWPSVVSPFDCIENLNKGHNKAW